MRPFLVFLIMAGETLDAQPAFVTPIEGEPFRDWTIVNYVDRMSGPGILDYRGGEYTYDGHAGVDFTLPHFLAMDTGVNILAAADGVVSMVHDGEYDRNTSFNSRPANQVTINHGDGWETRYLHLKRSSLSVKVGDAVRAGQKIAQAGSSGNSTDAHLHFEVRRNGGVVDPFYDALWQVPIPYAGETPRMLDAGITDHFSSTAEFKEHPRKGLFFPLNALCVHWVQLFAVDHSDVLKWEFYSPAGAKYAEFSATPDTLIRYGWYHAGWYLPGNQPGKWRSRFYINGVLFSELHFYASTMQDSDSDGLYDDAETAPLIVGQDDSQTDSDGDGASNVSEFYFATDPSSPDSRPVLHLSQNNSRAVTLRFDAPAGRRVFIQRASDLSAGEWNNYRHVCSGPNRLLNLDLLDLAPRGFFRISAGVDE
ncbi:MAG: M23 family metallopeptidase [Nitrospirae bacterium]|nr:MAG: M23 family metallopeptidase [Nitrospirota bacterium]